MSSYEIVSRIIFMHINMQKYFHSSREVLVSSSSGIRLQFALLILCISLVWSQLLIKLSPKHTTHGTPPLHSHLPFSVPNVFQVWGNGKIQIGSLCSDLAVQLKKVQASSFQWYFPKLMSCTRRTKCCWQNSYFNAWRMWPIQYVFIYPLISTQKSVHR